MKSLISNLTLVFLAFPTFLLTISRYIDGWRDG